MFMFGTLGEFSIDTPLPRSPGAGAGAGTGLRVFGGGGLNGAGGAGAGTTGNRPGITLCGLSGAGGRADGPYDFWRLSSTAGSGGPSRCSAMVGDARPGVRIESAP